MPKKKKITQTRLGLILPVKLHKRAKVLAGPYGVSEVVRQLLKEWVDNEINSDRLSCESAGVFRLSHEARTLRADADS